MSELRAQRGTLTPPAGDARSGSTKRVVSAVGEGSIAVATVCLVLAE